MLPPKYASLDTVRLVVEAFAIVKFVTARFVKNPLVNDNPVPDIEVVEAFPRVV